MLLKCLRMRSWSILSAAPLMALSRSPFIKIAALGMNKLKMRNVVAGIRNLLWSLCNRRLLRPLFQVASLVRAVTPHVCIAPFLPPSHHLHTPGSWVRQTDQLLT